MKRFIMRVAAAVMGFSMLAVVSATATSVTLQELTTYGYGVTIHSTVDPLNYNGGTTAGIYKLLVDGTPTDSFCIDLGRYSTSVSQTYNVVGLDAAPLSPSGPMGAIPASQIKQLWEQFYSPGMSAGAAGDLQLAIWYIAATAIGETITFDAPHANAQAPFLTWLSLNPNAPQANLVGLVNDTYQNYVIEVVPDGGTTLTLLGLALVGLGGLRRKLSV